ncbi:MAG: SIS domain-containing protein [Bacteroidales bacterium]|nr:SIS domain-containing protein [Bacteroidales bacterium]
MNLSDKKYNNYALVREMMETPDVIRSFKPEVSSAFAKLVKEKEGLFLSGEGSSRIFPAKRAIYDNFKRGSSLNVFTEGATQSLEYSLEALAVFGASNSGQTKEVVRLIKALKAKQHNACFGLTANPYTSLEEICDLTHVLACGKEDAVAATKSVVEQALFYDALINELYGTTLSDLEQTADKVNEVLTMEVDPEITRAISAADVIYFAGRNTGVAEELTLKTNEITRKRSEFLEGTYGVHGIEEVMNPNEVVIWINPFEDEMLKFKECLIDGVGMKIVAISRTPTIFPTMLIPDAGNANEYVELAAGWNLLVETGIAAGIDLDKPERARKVGNAL